jgi:hypothetical protein
MSTSEIILLAVLVVILGFVSIAYIRRSNKRYRERILAQAAAREAQLTELAEKYGDDDAIRIIDGGIWQGMTAEMLRDARGQPVSVDQDVVETNVTEVWHYQAIGRDQYTLGVMLEDGVVVSWERKNG